MDKLSKEQRSKNFKAGSILFNSGNTTNFIYGIIGENTESLDIEAINKIEIKPKILNRILKVKSLGFDLKYFDVNSDVFKLNLQLIDSDLPLIIANLLLLKYLSPGVSRISELLTQMKVLNPLGFDLSKGHPFYEYRLKNFLTDCALGLTPSKLWNGEYEATGRIIIVKDNGDLACYHIYNRNEFQNYLINNTILEQSSTTRYDFGYFYYEGKQLFIKLNLQIRFIQ